MKIGEQDCDSTQADNRDEPNGPFGEFWLTSSYGCGRCAGLPRFGNPAQFIREVASALPAPLRFFRQTAFDATLQRRRSHGLEGSDRSGFLFEDCRSHAELALPWKRTLAGEHLVQHRCQRKKVAPAIEFLPFDLFRRHVLKCSHNGALLGHRRGLCYRCRQRGHAR